MSGPSGKHRSPRRLLGGWDAGDLALTEEAARSVGESWSEWMRRVAVEAAREELEAPEVGQDVLAGNQRCRQK